MSEELKSCPFCGCDDLSHKSHQEYACPTDYYIRCNSCGAKAYAGAYKEREDAIKAWNTRASGWISVDERLPENGQQVFIYQDIETYYFDEIEKAEFAVNGLMKIFAIGGKVVYPTHWMPLPEQPK